MSHRGPVGCWVMSPRCIRVLSDPAPSPECPHTIAPEGHKVGDIPSLKSTNLASAK
jgi:hypothetical protein